MVMTDKLFDILTGSYTLIAFLFFFYHIVSSRLAILNKQVTSFDQDELSNKVIVSFFWPLHLTYLIAVAIYLYTKKIELIILDWVNLR